jgi:hypothetical protein
LSLRRPGRKQHYKSEPPLIDRLAEASARNVRVDKLRSRRRSVHRPPLAPPLWDSCTSARDRQVLNIDRPSNVGTQGLSVGHDRPQSEIFAGLFWCIFLNLGNVHSLFTPLASRARAPWGSCVEGEQNSSVRIEK